MGFSYRKSFRAGPIRVGASKAGISYSVGVKGVRVTKRADGRLQAALSAPGTGLLYSGSKRAGIAADDSTSASPTAKDLRAAYQQIYTTSIQLLRTGRSGAEIRGNLHSRGLAHPRLLKAVTNAEKHLADETMRRAKQKAKDAQEARMNGLAAEAAEALEQGTASHLVDRWLKKERGVGFMARGDVMGRAKKIRKANIRRGASCP
ncbi:DUF4236 domain-containing protein [Streptomyces sp. ASQP_92]|uniref:DUF4236 domain-containing protein n=1 Tax=Streptomyces sp. ASQP_92 TaxID=2979116 RepID=UPI0021BFDE7D|nr:DUF4236 domain-containing protein [Streptomyces sp. ASQP_92]MCT9089508.1 DUF4236 domain-containing protein [Streptomyces sp. ASQP_92]